MLGLFARRRALLLATAAPPDETLLRAVVILRAMGARITRYDGDDGSLEARLARWYACGTVRVCAAPDGDGSRVRIESDAPAWSLTRRLLTRELSSGEGSR